jgi:2Fe-2S ferredoxin
MLILKGRTIQKEVSSEAGKSLLDIAVKHGLDWAHSCTRGTCARCRCFIEEGQDLLNKPTEAELDRLDPKEIEQGYRLGCQAAVNKDGVIKVFNKPYF